MANIPATDKALSSITSLPFGDDPAVALKRAYGIKRSWFESVLNEGIDAQEINALHTDMTDRILRLVLNSIAEYPVLSEKVSIIALGGYGRCELGLHCDIDLMFLHDGIEEDAIRKIVERVLYPFWDSGVEIGGATRTIDDCRSVIMADVRALTAMLDVRLISGNDAIFANVDGISKNFFSDKRRMRQFVNAKFAEGRERLRRFGDSIFLLQPNIKEGEGGLRDFHTLEWISRASSFESEGADPIANAVPNVQARHELMLAVGFLWKIRHYLHLIEGKRNDRLSEGIQTEVAERMGFALENNISASEQLMSSYYKHASTIHLITERALDRIRKRVFPSGRMRRAIFRRNLGKGTYISEYGTLVVEAPLLRGDRLASLQAFYLAKERSRPLDPETKDVIAHLEDAELPVKDGERANAIWRNIFSDFKWLDKTLGEMHECGFLARWFPELKPMLYLVQHDGFHIYTTGAHSIRAVGEISRLYDSRSDDFIPFQKEALKFVRRPHVLALAAFFHDVGKGRGGGHCDKGADLAFKITSRIGFEDEDAEDVAFLVRSHLTMAKLAFRRDISDLGLLNRFSQSMRSAEILTMLFLMTFADIRAIGPNIWSEWKGGLLAELYRNTMRALKEGGITDEGRLLDAARYKRKINSHLGKFFSMVDIESHLHELPDRYLFSVAPETIAAHIMMSHEIHDIPVAMMSRVVEGMGCSEISVVTRDKPGLFAQIAGVLTAEGANITDAQLYTTKNGVAMDVILFTDAMGGPLADVEKWVQIRNSMCSVISGELDIRRLVEKHFKSSFLGTSSRKLPTNITIDNDVSAAATVVEIHAGDRRGLLYIMASTLHNLGLTIDTARITTHVDRVIDVFYIKNSDGQKIFDKQILERIECELHRSIEE